MILRKPYAFLIKHFRLIHIIITILLACLLIINSNVYQFINSCISDSVNRYNALEYINYNIYIYIGVSLVLFYIVNWLLKYKDKPRNVYLIAMIGYIVVGIVMFIIFTYLQSLVNISIDQKTIRLYRDIMTITIIYQYIMCIIMLIRGLGFDIKKFNFSKDVHELNLTEEDGEEIEVSVGVDTNKIMRNVRKQKREFGYFFREYRVIIIGILSIILVVIIAIFSNKIKDKLKVYEENVYVGTNNYISVTNSYYNISNDKTYVIIKFDAGRPKNKDKLTISNLILSINDKTYLPNKNICYLFDSIGTCYKQQNIVSTPKSYIIVYEVEDINTQNSYIIYKDSYDKNYKIKLNLVNY